MGNRNWKRDAYALGTIRIHKSGKSRVRVVKVTHHGPKHRRWRDVARVWWEKNRGPVPEGMRVVHMDGDTLNDDPKNYGLLTGGELVKLYVRLNPKIRQRMEERRAEATAKSNRLRGSINRAIRFLPTYYYPVDFKRKIIINRPRRKRWQVYADCGVPVNSKSCRTTLGMALGWPGLSIKHACMLRLLTERGPMSAEELRAAVDDLQQLLGWRGGFTMPVFYSYISKMKRRGLIAGRGRYYHTAAAIEARHSIQPFVAVWGQYLQAEKFKDFARSDDLSIEQMVQQERAA